jgi:hypothetical protein
LIESIHSCVSSGSMSGSFWISAMRAQTANGRRMIGV